MAKIATEVCASVYARMFEGSVHRRSVPVRIDATPAPADRRRLPENKDMVRDKGIAPYTGAKRLLYKVVRVGAQVLSNLRPL